MLISVLPNRSVDYVKLSDYKRHFFDASIAIKLMD